MKILFASAILLSSLILSRAQRQDPIPLWPNGAPGALGDTTNDIPTITPYLPAPANLTGAAMVICPAAAMRTWRGTKATITRSG